MLVYLIVVHKSEWLYECISVVLALCPKVSELGHYRHVDTLGLAVCLLMIPCCREVFINKKATQNCEKFRYKLCAVVCKKEGKDAVRYSLKIKNDVRSVRRFGLRRRNSPSEL